MIEVRQEDLLTADVECVVRAVTSDLDPVTSLSRAVGEAAGADLGERIERMGELPVGGAVITPGGELQAAFMVHIVIQSAEEPATAAGVRKALVNGLRHACRLGVETMALPPLGTGVGSLDAEVAADVMVSALREHLEREEYPKQVVVMVTSAYEFDVFAARIRKPAGALVGGPEDGPEDEPEDESEDGPEEGATDSSGNGLVTGIRTSREEGDSNGDGA